MATSSSARRNVVEVTRRFVSQKVEYFTDIHVWPSERIDVDGWLGNFVDPDIPHAAQLLNAFVFFNARTTGELFRAAFHGLSRVVGIGEESFEQSQRSWNRFLSRVIVTRITGEQPSDADSGFAFVRLARDLLAIEEDQILSPGEALEAAAGSDRPIVFVDDFVGSGNQCNQTWKRSYTLSNGQQRSFADLGTGKNQIFYVPLVCTEMGQRSILDSCRGLRLLPVHLLPKTFSALHPTSVLWPENLLPTGAAFIERVCVAAKIPGWRGFHDLGLAIGFEHCVPDATLPMFTWASANWKPLVRRA